MEPFLRLSSVVSDQRRDGAFALCHCVVSNVLSTFLTLWHWEEDLCLTKMPHSPALKLMIELGY